MRPARLAQHPAVERLRRTPTTELVRRIRGLETLKLTTATDDMVRRRLARVMDAYATKPFIAEGSRVLRARVNVGSKSYENLSDLWYPPADLVGRGRFNRPGQPVFYAVNEFFAAFFEVRAKLGDHVTVLECRGADGPIQLKLAHVAVAQYNLDSATGIVNIDQLRDDARFMGKLRSSGILKKWERVDGFLCRLATYIPDDESTEFYRLSGALADVLMAIPEVDGLLYPSAASRQSAVNFRLNADVADRAIRPTAVWQFVVTRHRHELPGAPPSDDGYFGLDAVRAADSFGPSGQIQWAAPAEQKRLFRQMASWRLTRIRA